jgi:hypothetical protein
MAFDITEIRTGGSSEANFWRLSLEQLSESLSASVGFSRTHRITDETGADESATLSARP